MFKIEGEYTEAKIFTNNIEEGALSQVYGVCNSKEIANRLAKRCVGTNTDKLHFAMQLFVEEVVLDNTVDNYDEKDMEQYILEYLNMKGR